MVFCFGSEFYLNNSKRNSSETLQMNRDVNESYLNNNKRNDHPLDGHFLWQGH